MKIKSNQPLIRFRYGFTIIELLVVIGIIAILIGLLLPAIQKARESSRKLQCTGNLKQLGLATQQYHEIFHYYPGGLRYLLPPTVMSPQARILPYMGQQVIFDALNFDRTFDEDYAQNFTDDPNARVPIPGFRCSSDSKINQSPLSLSYRVSLVPQQYL